MNINFEDSEDDVGMTEDLPIVEDEVFEEDAMKIKATTEVRKNGKGKGKGMGKKKGKGKGKAGRPTENQGWVNVVVNEVFCMRV